MAEQTITINVKATTTTARKNIEALASSVASLKRSMESLSKVTKTLPTAMSGAFSAIGDKTALNAMAKLRADSTAIADNMKSISKNSGWQKQLSKGGSSSKSGMAGVATEIAKAQAGFVTALESATKRAVGSDPKAVQKRIDKMFGLDAQQYGTGFRGYYYSAERSAKTIIESGLAAPYSDKHRSRPLTDGLEFQSRVNSAFGLEGGNKRTYSHIGLEELFDEADRRAAALMAERVKVALESNPSWQTALDYRHSAVDSSLQKQIDAQFSDDYWDSTGSHTAKSTAHVWDSVFEAEDRAVEEAKQRVKAIEEAEKQAALEFASRLNASFGLEGGNKPTYSHTGLEELFTPLLDAADKADALQEAAEKVERIREAFDANPSWQTALDFKHGATDTSLQRRLDSEFSSKYWGDSAKSHAHDFDSIFEAEDRAAEEAKRAAQEAAQAAKTAAKERAQAAREASKAEIRAAREATDATKALNKERSDAWHRLSNGTLSQLIRGFGRIARYRFIKGVLKGITDGVRVGTTNLVEYSRAMNSLDSASASNTMNQIATSMQYLKNSVGAAAMPLIQQLLPVLQSITSWAVNAANAINMFISALQGKGTFTKAKEQAVEYGKALDSAGGSAKKLQQLMDFDEINNITTNDGGGGGGGASATDYSGMFEEAEITSNIKKLTDYIKENFDGILDTVVAIGTAIGLWKLSNALKTDFGWLKTLAGIILVVEGVKWSFSGGYDIGHGDNELLGYIKVVLGAAAAGIGGSLIATTTGLATGGVGFAIGVGISLVASIVGFSMGKADAKFENSEFGQAIAYIKDTAQGVIDNATSSLSELASAVETYTSVATDASTARGLVDQLYEILDKSDKTSKDLEDIETLIGVINSLKLNGITLQYDELTGTVNETKTKVMETIDAIEEQAKKQAKIELLKEAYKALEKATADNEVAVKNAKTAQEKYAEATNATVEYIKKHADTGVNTFSSEWRELKRNEDEARVALDLANEAVDESKRVADTAAGYISAYGGKIGDLKVQSSDAIKPVKDVTGAVKDLNTNGTAQVTVKTSGLDSALEKLKSIAGYVKNSSGDISFSGNATSKVKTYASGGFPRQGSMFVAGETVGETEWLGNVNGKTGVVSGREITGIADSIYSTGAAELAELRTQNALLTALLDKQLTISPSASLGRTISMSNSQFSKVTGA